MITSILPYVSKPTRYTGNELNAVRKYGKPSLKVVLAYPDVYEIGMSNLGVRILYHLINKREDLVCERVFAPWVDMEDILRKENIPLVSLESHTPLKDFDIVGFSLQYELLITNVVNMLDLAMIPIRSADREKKDPLIIGGGPCCFNPLPYTPFFDFFVIGDGEEVIFDIIEPCKDWRSGGISKDELKREISKIEGVWVPGVNDGKVVKKRTADLGEFPLPPIVPYCEVHHDRLSIEVMKGCTRGCRFCQVGMVLRPARERSVKDVLDIAKEGLKTSGWDELSLVSLSSSDYSNLEELLFQLNEILSGQRVAISLPSLRSDAFNESIAENLSKVRKTGLTLAPEAGTQRMRNIINKGVKEEDILKSCEFAFKYGWDKVKLYFMIGLPEETPHDIEGIIDLVRKISKSFHNKQIKLSISPFVPKAHTPFQWARQEKVEDIMEKERYLKRNLKLRNVNINIRNPFLSFIEAVLSRGDSQLARVIEVAWRRGAKFDEWTEFFNYENWRSGFDEKGIDPYLYIQKRELDSTLPWDFISTGVKKEFLKKEMRKAEAGTVTEDCRESGCIDYCGVCDEKLKNSLKTLSTHNTREKTVSKTIYGRKGKRIPQAGNVSYRFKYRRDEELKFLSHLDIGRLLMRCIRMAEIPVVYTRGFVPRVKISFGPPLPVGILSVAEYFDLNMEYPFEGIKEDLNNCLPAGLKLLDAKQTFRPKSLSAMLDVAEYEVDIEMASLEQKVNSLLNKDRLVIRRKRGEIDKEVDLRPLIKDIVTADRLKLLLEIGNRGSARPDEVLSLLLNEDPKEVLKYRITRTGLFKVVDKRFITPFELA